MPDRPGAGAGPGAEPGTGRTAGASGGGPAGGPDLERAARLRQEGERLQAEGAYAEALDRYRQSLQLRPDPDLEDRVKRIDTYLEVR
jgi:tetratricopeptide (TPR) repeat protein